MSLTSLKTSKVKPQEAASAAAMSLLFALWQNYFYKKAAEGTAVADEAYTLADSRTALKLRVPFFFQQDQEQC